MSGLIPKNTARFHSDKEATQRHAVEYMKFISANIAAFKSKATKKNREAFLQFQLMVKNNEPFNDFEKSYINDLYEKTMAGLGLPSYKGQKSKWGVNLKA